MAKKQIINMSEERYGLFQGDKSYALDIKYGREYLKKDVNFKVTLYRVNILETKVHKLYGQTKAKNKSYFPPITFNAMVTIEDGKLESYGGDNSGVSREDSGNMVVGIYLDELKEKNIEINRGDILMYNASGEKNRYYEVDNANYITDSTSKTMGGYKPYWREVIAFPVKSDVVTMFENS